MASKCATKSEERDQSIHCEVPAPRLELKSSMAILVLAPGGEQAASMASKCATKSEDRLSSIRSKVLAPGLEPGTP